MYDCIIPHIIVRIRQRIDSYVLMRNGANPNPGERELLNAGALWTLAKRLERLVRKRLPSVPKFVIVIPMLPIVVNFDPSSSRVLRNDWALSVKTWAAVTTMQVKTVRRQEAL